MSATAYCGRAVNSIVVQGALYGDVGYYDGAKCEGRAMCNTIFSILDPRGSQRICVVSMMTYKVNWYSFKKQINNTRAYCITT